MLAKRSFTFAVALLPLALGCSNGADTPKTSGAVDSTAASGGMTNTGASGGAPRASGAGDNARAGAANFAGANAGSADDGALIVPAGVTIMPLSGGNGVLDMFAVTLEQNQNATLLYAALKNDGDSAACDAALTVQLFDKNQQPLGASVGGLLTQHLYQFTDGTGTVAACIGPGDVTMGAITDLPNDFALDDVGFVVYSSMYFAIDVTPISGFTVSDVKSVAVSDGIAFTGTFTNGFATTVSTPSVAVFPVNSVGRPLATATATGTDDLASGSTWAFQTSSVETLGTSAVAYPTASISN